MMKSSLALTVAAFALGLAACGPKGTGPAAAPTNVGRANAHIIPAADEKILSDALAKKKAGDIGGAFKLAESLPIESPARLDNRYDEITNAWSDLRSKQVGEELGLGVGGGPPVASGTDVDPNAPKGALDTPTFDRVVDKQRGALRTECFKANMMPTEFAISLHVDNKGVVRSVLIDNVKGDRAVSDCVRSQVYEWKFPTSGAGGDYTTTLNFRVQ